MSSPYDKHFWQLREMQRVIDSMQSQWDLIQTIPQGILDQMEEFRRLEEQFTLPADYLNVVREIEESLQALYSFQDLNILAEAHLQVFEGIRVHQREFEAVAQQISQAQELYQPISELVVQSLAPVEALLETNRIEIAALDTLLLPQTAYQDFASSQLNLITEQASDLAIANRLDFIAEAGDLLEHMVRGFELGALMQDSVPAWEPLESHVLQSSLFEENNLYARLAVRVDEIDFDDREFDAEDIVLETCEAKLAELGHRLVRLVRDLNVEAERGGLEVPFKPTTRALYACGTLPAVVASDEDSFNIIVDQLYFLLYEGSGSAKRLVVKYGSGTLEALWRLKHLRLGARHDVDHGKAAEIEAKQKKIGQAFKDLIGFVSPKEVLDWCKAQLSLYEQLIEMLEYLWFGNEEEDDGSGPEAGEGG